MTPNKFLALWLKEKGLTINEINKRCGYESNYLYQLLMPNGQRPVTYEVLGRLLVAYGKGGPAVAMAALMPKIPVLEKPNGNGKK